MNKYFFTVLAFTSLVVGSVSFYAGKFDQPYSAPSSTSSELIENSIYAGKFDGNRSSPIENSIYAGKFDGNRSSNDSLFYT